MTPPGLDEGLTALGLSAALAAPLGTYAEAIARQNEALGLVSLKDPADLLVRHLLDSLAPWRVLEGLGFKSLADLGSGAGFPGIPLALAFPSVPVALVERMERRVAFLTSVVGQLGRPGLTVDARTFEEVKEQFDLVTFRAVTPLEPKVVRKMLRLLRPGGTLAAYKGRRAVADAEVAALGALNLSVQVVPIQVPFLDEERHLVLLTR